MHYLMLISEKPQMLFQTELLIRSVKKFAKNKPSYFSIVVNGEERINSIVYPSLTKGTINNKYIASNAEIWKSPYFWEIPIPNRWFIEPKSEKCVFIDADVIACRDLEELYNLDENFFHGVQAHMNPLSNSEWFSLGLNEEKIKKLNYFNMGMLVVPSKYLKIIGEGMMKVLQNIIDKFPNRYYYSAQIAVSKALYDLQIPTNHLPEIFNWYDAKPPKNLNEIIFLHYFMNRGHVINLKEINTKANEYTKMIGQIANDVFKSSVKKTFL